MTRTEREEEKKRLYELIAQSYTSNRSKWEVELFEDYMLQQEIPKLVDDLLDGGVIVPPCKVGDRLYQVMDENKICECEVVSFHYAGEDKLYADVESCKHKFMGYTMYSKAAWSVNVNRLGITVFLSREEAEQALKERS
jgi:hypothetical protein